MQKNAENTEVLRKMGNQKFKIRRKTVHISGTYNGKRKPVEFDTHKTHWMQNETLSNRPNVLVEMSGRTGSTSDCKKRISLKAKIDSIFG